MCSIFSHLTSRRCIWISAAASVAWLAFGSLLERPAAYEQSAQPRTLADVSVLAATVRVSSTPPPITEDARVTLGRRMFFDENLSEPHGTSCAACHDPAEAYSGAHRSEIGTAQGSRKGRYARRNTPSVMYLRFVRRPHLVWDDDGDRPELFGGFFWDGRADTIASLVREPLLNPNEMNNRDLRQIADKVKHSSYAADLAREFDDVFASGDKTIEAISFCIEAFLTSGVMSPFSSKYDDFVRGTAALSDLETRGLALFEDSNKGACSGCHRLDHSTGLPQSSMFTDYGYDAIAVPRNRALPENRDPRRFDLGVCGHRSQRLHTEDAPFCGAFRTPSLRNVAKRTRFMHNGYFSSLRDVVSFYATRATDPERWYAHGTFDDLPAKYADNVNQTLPPYDQLKGDPRRLTDADVAAIVAFLEALSDRDIPSAP